MPGGGNRFQAFRRRIRVSAPRPTKAIEAGSGTALTVNPFRVTPSGDPVAGTAVMESVPVASLIIVNVALHMLSPVGAGVLLL
jgi:hypothetical protein